MISEKLLNLITEQQKGHEDGPVYCVGEQLKEIAEREPRSAELLEQDLQVEGMRLWDAEKKIKAYADSHKKGSFAFVSPMAAEKILREFYGLPSSSDGEGTPPPEEKKTEPDFLNLEDFL